MWINGNFYIFNRFKFFISTFKQPAPQKWWWLCYGNIQRNIERQRERDRMGICVSFKAMLFTFIRNNMTPNHGNETRVHNSYVICHFFFFSYYFFFPFFSFFDSFGWSEPSKITMPITRNLAMHCTNLHIIIFFYICFTRRTIIIIINSISMIALRLMNNSYLTHFPKYLHGMLFRGFNQ